jgi:hypothetical protein
MPFCRANFGGKLPPARQLRASAPHLQEDPSGLQRSSPANGRPRTRPSLWAANHDPSRRRMRGRACGAGVVAQQRQAGKRRRHWRLAGESRARLRATDMQPLLPLRRDPGCKSSAGVAWGPQGSGSESSETSLRLPFPAQREQARAGTAAPRVASRSRRESRHLGTSLEVRPRPVCAEPRREGDRGSTAPSRDRILRRIRPEVRRMHPR